MKNDITPKADTHCTCMHTTAMTSLHITMKSTLQVRNLHATVLVCISKDNVGVKLSE